MKNLEIMMVTKKRRMNFIHTLHDERYEFYSYPWCQQFHRNNENSYPCCSINKLHKNSISIRLFDCNP